MMIKRMIWLSRGHSFFLFGPRQTGKSTLIRSVYGNACWEVNLLQTQQFFKYSKEPYLFREEAEFKIARQGIRTIFVDEIQKVPLLLDEIHDLIERHPRVRFILTGSSARKLRRGAANLLAGRIVTRQLFPFTYWELGKDFVLEDALRFGTLPALYGKSEAGKIEILRAYAETYLREEIQSEGLVRNLGGFSRFLDVAASLCNEQINFSAIAREAALPVRTVQSYFDILEDTLIAIRLEGWRKSARKRLAAHSKFYLFDTGITNTINRRLSEPPDPQLRGRLFEQWIVLETHRLLHYLRSECRLFYWRTNAGADWICWWKRGANPLWPWRSRPLESSTERP